MRIRWILLAVLPALFAAGAGAQNNTAVDWSKPFPPHKIAGNLYFVGSEQLASFLIVTPEGNILINSDFEQTVPVIRASVEKLGFKFTDIKILLGSHAHGDHMEGDALVKELTAARVMAMEQDVPALRKMTPGGKPHPIDHILHDGEQVTLGGTTLVAHLTPGHTKGCTTWTMKVNEGGKMYDVVILGSVSVNPGYVLVGNKDYPQIAADYARSFQVLKALPCDIFLGSHGSFYGMAGKYAKLEKGGANPFIDPQGYRAYLDDREKAFQSTLNEQKQKAPQNN
ncbi:MAG: subclass B3 metallo-beta-lactamase [Acidobacteriia bacterium]|nr:subclass B3 metallo-beta-lactamase [Terriglobia bacterium]MBV8902251.1 subclass B3 metallo-beta-lactamase [Terriglobia bacterium]MBV9746732.1 subclass B3 metallo-beta-lactamase [Terriglobia bacterium]